MKVQDVMINNVELVNADDPVLVAAQLMAEQNVGALPVADRDRLIGMITDRDVVVRVVASRRDPQVTPVREAMTQGVKYCYEDEDLTHVMHNMDELGVQRLPVMTRSKRLAGIISRTDIEAALV